MARSVSNEKRAAWRRRLQRFTRGDVPVAEFCEREGVSPSSFYLWRKKLAGGVTESETAQPQVTASSFVPVEVLAALDLQVVFPNGARLTVAAHDHGLVRTVIDTLARTTQQTQLEGDE